MNQDTLDKVIEYCLDDTLPVEMEEGVNDKIYDNFFK